MFAELCDHLYRFQTERKAALKDRDEKREQDPEWFKKTDMLGMMLYIDNFAGDLRGVQKKLSYLEECHVLMEGGDRSAWYKALTEEFYL